MSITRLELPNGEWIDVKDRQTAGDEANVNSYSNEGISADGNRYNVVRHRIGTAAVRIKAWSLTNDEGKVIAWPGPASSFRERCAVIEKLYEEQNDLIGAAISKHLAALAAARAEEKKETTVGETGSAPSSPSAS